MRPKTVDTAKAIPEIMSVRVILYLETNAVTPIALIVPITSSILLALFAIRRSGIEAPRKKDAKLEIAARVGDSWSISWSTAPLTLEYSPRDILTAPAKAAANPGVMILAGDAPLVRRLSAMTVSETTPSWNPMMLGRITGSFIMFIVLQYLNLQGYDGF
jgi:hypothetical protein